MERPRQKSPQCAWNLEIMCDREAQLQHQMEEVNLESVKLENRTGTPYTYKKENQIFLVCKEI
jgi:hypothetical protein